MRPRAALALAGLILSVVVAERLDVARSLLQAVEDARGDTSEVAPSLRLTLIWVAVTVVGGRAALVLVRAVQAAQPRARKEHAERWLKYSSWAALATWVAWSITGPVALAALPVPIDGARKFLHLVTIAALVVALAHAARLLTDVAIVFRTSSPVRVHVLVLTGVFAVVFLVPLTAGQTAEVFRAWTEVSSGRWLAAVAAALLLGSVCRVSALRLLAAPSAFVELKVTRSTFRVVLGGVVLVVSAALCAVLGMVVGVLMVVFALVAKFHRTDVSLHQPDDAEWRLGWVLAVVPLGIVLVGVTAATIDSFLLRRPATDDWELLAITASVVALFVVLAQRTLEVADRPLSGVFDESRSLMGWAFVAGVTIGVLAGVYGQLTELVPGLAVPPGPVLMMPFLVAPFLLAAGVLAFHRWDPRETWQLTLAAGIVAGVALMVLVDPIGAPRALGAFAVALIGATALLLLLTGATQWGAQSVQVGRHSFTLPVVTLLVVWIGIAASWPMPTVHQAVTVRRETQQVSVASAVDAWLANNRSTVPADEPLPLVLVAASGGGAKAAYWTDLVIDCLLGDQLPKVDGESDTECVSVDPSTTRTRLDRVFATSSVSGGSVGVFHLLRRREDIEDGREWVSDTRTEVLSPIVAWGLMHDLPAFLLRASTDPQECTSWFTCRRHADRGLVQEAAVAGSDDIVPAAGPGLLEGEDWPIPVFNSAEDGGQRRVLLSRLELVPRRANAQECPTPSGRDGESVVAALDAYHAIPGLDVRPVTAALLTARFPVVASEAVLGREENPEATGDVDCTPAPVLLPVQLRDGGYIENTGLLTITEMIPSIQHGIELWNAKRPEASRREVQILVVSIDDDPWLLDPRPLAPDAGLMGITQRASTSHLSRSARDRLTSCQFANVSYVRFSPPVRAGARAATGWQTSAIARRKDLVAGLNRDALPWRDIRAALDGRVERGCRTYGVTNMRPGG